MTPYPKSQRSVSNHGSASFWKTIVSSFEAKASSPPCVDPAIVQYTMQMVSSISYPGVTPWKTTKKCYNTAEKYHALGSCQTSRNSSFFTAFTNFLRAGNKNSSLLSGTSGLFKHCSDEGKWDRNTKVALNSRLPSSPKNRALKRQELFFNYFNLTFRISKSSVTDCTIITTR